MAVLHCTLVSPDCKLAVVILITTWLVSFKTSKLAMVKFNCDQVTLVYEQIVMPDILSVSLHDNLASVMWVEMT